MNESSKFGINLRNHNGIVIIDISGYLDAYTANDLEQTIFKTIQGGDYKIIVNFKELDYISSAGLGVFMAFIEEIREKNGDIKLSNMNSKVFSVFDLLGFPMLFDIHKEEAFLIEKFSSSIA